MSQLFIWFFTFLCIIIFLQSVHSSFFSRFKNPHEYVAPPEAWLEPEELPPDIYAKLLQERPDLAPSKRRVSHGELNRMPFLRKTRIEYDEDASDEDDSDGFENEDEEAHGEDYTRPTPTGRSTMLPNTTLTTSLRNYQSSSRLMPYLTTDNRNASWDRSYPRRGRKWFWDSHQFRWYGKHVATCFLCGAFTTGIPVNPLCHEAFASQNWKYRTAQRYFRAKCFYNTKYWAWRREPVTRNDIKYTRGNLIMGFYGRYVAGCYKKFLDIGSVYTSRGCRTWWPRNPQNHKNFATHRFRRLEMILKKQKDACIVSPHASLTPFARGISLFARYHLCVCSGKYCNAAIPAAAYHYVLLFILLNISLVICLCFFFL